MIVAIDDAGVDSCVPAERYEDFLERGGTEPLQWMVDDEERVISINYTSGTTGRPKGVDVHPPRCLPQRARRG